MSDVVAALRAQGIDALSVEQAGGGASARMWRVDLDGTDAVLRCPRVEPGGMAIGAEAEVRVLRAAVEAGVPAPRVIASVAPGGGIGAGYLMERLDGEALPGRLLRDERFARARPGLVTETAAALARIHAVQGDLGLPTLGPSDQLDLLEGVHRSYGEPVPAFELALRWLRAHLPPPVPPTLVHGDLRLGNLLVSPDGLVAVLDWELAHQGDPAEDLGWLCARPWRFGGPGEAAGLAPRADLLAAYSAAGGAAIDPDRLHYWEVLASLKWGVICQVQAARHTREHPSLEHAVIGRRVVESELDLLVLLEEAS